MWQKAGFIVIVILIVGIGFLFFISRNNIKRSPSLENKQVGKVNQISPKTELDVPTLTPTKEIDREDKLLSLSTTLLKKYGQQAMFVVNNSDKNYAQGTLKGKNGQDRWWLATNVSSGKWIIVAEGYSYVNCNDIAAYHFPNSIVPVCWGKSILVTR